MELTDKQASSLESILSDHKKNFVSNEFNANGVKGVYWTDLSRRPAEVKAAFRYEELEGITGISFLETSEAVRVDQRKSAIEDKIAEIVGSGDISEHSLPESEIIRSFGLFGRDSAEVSHDAWKSFEGRVQKTVSKRDAEAILAVVDNEAFKDLERKRLAKPFLQFETISLHKQVLQIAERNEVDWPILSFYGKNDQAGMLRRQAAEIYPLFVSYFAQNSMFARRVIQKQLPLNAALADKLGLKEKALKRLQKKSWSLHGLSPEEVGQALSSIPADWIPQDEAEWESFCILTKTVGRKFGTPLGYVSEAPFDALYKGAKGNWREFHERCVLAFREDRAPQGMNPDLVGHIEKRIKKDKKALNKALRKGERDFDSELSKLLGRFQTKGIDEAGLLDWMRKAVSTGPVEAPEGVNPEFTDMLVADVESDMDDLKKSLKADDGSFSQKGKDVLHRYIVSDSFKESVKTWVHDLFHPDMSETFLNVAVDAAREMTEFVARHVVFPAAAHAVIDNGNVEKITYGAEQRLACLRAAMQLLILPDGENPGSGKAFPNFLEVVRDFNQNHAAIAEKILGKGPDLSSIMNLPEGSWVPLFTGEIDLGEGIYAVCLTNEAELQDEGRRGQCADGTEGNHHCVGGYAYKCKSNFHHIISFRKRMPKGSEVPFERVGTLEVTEVAKGETKLKKNQYYRRNNQKPHEDALAAKDRLFLRVKNKEIDLNHEAMSAFKAANGVIERDVVEAACLYPWEKKENVTNAMFAVGKMIHSAFTKGENGIRDVDGLIAHPVLDPIVRTMDPIYEMTGEGLRASA